MKDEEKAKIRAEIIMSLKKGYKPKVTMTAVEWLEEELKGVYESDYFNKLLVKAKEMEKEQIEDAFEWGVAEGFVKTIFMGDKKSYQERRNSNEYYKETFKNTNK